MRTSVAKEDVANNTSLFMLGARNNLYLMVCSQEE